MASEADFETLEPFILELADAAAAIALPLFRSATLGEISKPGHSSGFDPVTEADKGAERAIRALIEARFPDHGIIGEEYGSVRTDAEFVWVLDPIDGTRAFISGLPLWTTLIGLRHRGHPVLGVISQPVLKEAFLGSPRGSRLITPSGSTPLKTRQDRVLKQAILATTDPHLFEGDEVAAVSELRQAAKLIRYGCDAYAFAMVAQGTMDVALETGLKAWDIDAIIPVIENAGGVVGDWAGEPVGPYGGQVVAAGSRDLLSQAVQYLYPASKPAVPH